VEAAANACYFIIMRNVHQKQLLLAIALLVSLTFALHSHAADNSRTRDVVYGRKAGMALVMDVWKPAKQNGAAVIFMVSGAFKSGIEMIDSGFYGPVGFKPFLDRGYTVFLVSHGAQPKFTVDEIVPDIHRAVRFIRTHAGEHGIDANRLGIMGISSGGYLSVMIGVTGGPGDASAEDPVDRESSRVQAVGAFCPPSDFVNYGQPGRNFLEYQPVDHVWSAFGVDGKPKEVQIETLRKLSPLGAITANMPPTVMIHGDNDPLVPVEQSKRFAAKLTELKVPHELIIRKDARHGWPTMGEDHALIADWFDEHLGTSGHSEPQ
jgi:acetyl esterase/lipase